MAFTQDAQKPIIRVIGTRNPGLSDGTTTLEFTYPPDTGSPGIRGRENATFKETAGGNMRKQADAWLRTARIRWKEPSNFIPHQVQEMLRGAGDRTRTLTYIHNREVLSQLASGVEDEHSPGIGKLNGFVRNFTASRIGKDATGTQMYQCELEFQEATEAVT